MPSPAPPVLGWKFGFTEANDTVLVDLDGKQTTHLSIYSGFLILSSFSCIFRALLWLLLPSHPWQAQHLGVTFETWSKWTFLKKGWQPPVAFLAGRGGVSPGGGESLVCATSCSSAKDSAGKGKSQQLSTPCLCQWPEHGPLLPRDGLGWQGKGQAAELGVCSS